MEGTERLRGCESENERGNGELEEVKFKSGVAVFEEPKQVWGANSA